MFLTKVCASLAQCCTANVRTYVQQHLLLSSVDISHKWWWKKGHKSQPEDLCPFMELAISTLSAQNHNSVHIAVNIPVQASVYIYNRKKKAFQSYTPMKTLLCIEFRTAVVPDYQAVLQLHSLHYIQTSFEVSIATPVPLILVSILTTTM